MSVAEWVGRSLGVQAGLNGTRLRSREWNPLGELIGLGDLVLIRPNWVPHRNRSGAGRDCPMTHASVLEAVLAHARKARSIDRGADVMIMGPGTS